MYELVKCNTIEPYTRISHIKYNQSNGITSILEYFNSETFGHEKLFTIKYNDKIPYEKWNINGDENE